MVALSAVAALSVMDALMKHLVIAIGVVAVTVWRSLANLLIATTLYLPRRLPWPTRKILKIHIARGTVMTVMALLFFWGMGRVPLAQAIALTFIAPLIALILAALTLKEEIGPRSIGGSVAGFAGVVAIVLGQARAELGREALTGSAAIIASAVCYAVNIVMMRHQAVAAKPLEINFFQSLTVMTLWLVALLFVGVPAWPGQHAGWVIVAALLSTSGGLLFSFAYARAEAGYLSVTEYSAFLWASALGWLIFHERVSLYTLAGASLIVAGCLMAVGGKAKEPPEMDYA